MGKDAEEESALSRARRNGSHLLAGLSGGAVSTLLMQPIDLLKVRFQVMRRPKTGMGGMVSKPPEATFRGAIRGIVQSDGFLGFWRGVVPALWGSSLSWGLYFLFYERAKRRYGSSSNNAWWKTTLAAWESSTMVVFVTNPIWVMKTRLQVQHAGTERPYKGMVDAFVRTWREEGVRGLYRGIVPALLLTSHGVIQFTIYEELKKLVNSTPSSSSQNAATSSAWNFMLAAASKLVATTATYPYQVIKSRLQVAPGDSQFRGFFHAVVETGRTEGVRGFFGGYLANAVRVVPSSAITITVYEAVKKALEQ